MSSLRYYATGKRKNSIARVWIEQGEGKMLVNQRPIEHYFPRETLRMIIQQPFDVTNQGGKFNLLAMVKGGGLSGQAGAIRHGVAKALLLADPQLREPLKRSGLLTRDPRVKERKKYGQKGARRRFQYSKR
jgi:small subunit ribosomal protein S9